MGWGLGRAAQGGISAWGWVSPWQLFLRDSQLSVASSQTLDLNLRDLSHNGPGSLPPEAWSWSPFPTHVPQPMHIPGLALGQYLDRGQSTVGLQDEAPLWFLNRSLSSHSAVIGLRAGFPQNPQDSQNPPRISLCGAKVCARDQHPCRVGSMWSPEPTTRKIGP